MSPARSMRVPVKKKGEACRSAIFPSEKTLDQSPYIKITARIDIITPKGVHDIKF
jgi:hypothetical protein